MSLVTHKFTPSAMSDAELEGTFVARAHTVEYLVKCLRDQIHSGTLSSFIITGPRGAGKSTVIHMVDLRIRRDPDLSAAWIPVLFPEEQFNISSLRDLLAETLRLLAKQHIASAQAWLDKVDGEPDDEQSEQLAITGLRELSRLSGKRLVLFVENLDLLFEGGLGDQMQGTLRRLVMNEPFMLLVSSSVHMFESLKGYAEPFFNYFGPVPLDRLNAEQVFELMQRRAEFDGNDQFLASFPQQRAKIRAIVELSGGNPRLVLMLYELLSQRQVTTIVQYLRQLVDELTPLFKHELESLAVQQRKLVHALMQKGGTATPTDLAAVTRLPLNAVTAQLKRMKHAQVVEVLGGGKGRAAHYTIPDKLFSIWYQMRYLGESRRIEMFVEVLQIWFDEEERLQTLRSLAASDLSGSKGRAHDYATTAEYFAASLRNTKHAKLAADLSIGQWAKADLEQAVLVYAQLIGDPLAVPDKAGGYAELAQWLEDHGDLARALKAIDRVIECDIRPSDLCEALLKRALLKEAQGDVAGEIADYSAAIELHGAPPKQVATALFNRALTRAAQGNVAAAVADFTGVIELVGAPPETVARALVNRGAARRALNDSAGAVADFTMAIEVPGAPPERVARAFYSRALTKSERGDVSGAVADYTAVIELAGTPPETVARALINRGVTRRQGLNDSAGAVADYGATIELPGAPPEQIAQALFNRGLAKSDQGDVSGEVADYTAIIDLVGAPPETVARALVNRGAARRALNDSAGAVADYGATIELPGAPPEQIAKALFNRALAKSEQGDISGEVADYGATIELPGALPEQIAQALFNRALARSAQGDVSGEVADYTAIIKLPGAPPEAVARALLNRGATKSALNDRAGAVADYGATIELPGAPPEQIAKALFNRALARSDQGDISGEVADYTATIDMVGAPPEEIGQALFNRALARSAQGDVSGEVADYTAIIDLVGAPPEEIAQALFNRALARSAQGDVSGEVADYTAIIDLVGAPPEKIAQALFNRALARSGQGDVSGEVADYTAIIKLPGASPEAVARALLNRGTTKSALNDSAGALDDYTTAIGLAGAPPRTVARALVNRGTTKSAQNDSASAVDDYTTAIGQPGAPSEEIANALFNRALTKRDLGDASGEGADYTTIISLAGAPPKTVAKALFNLALTKAAQGDVPGELADYAAIIRIGDAAPESLERALLARGIAHLGLGSTSDGVQDLVTLADRVTLSIDQMVHVGQTAARALSHVGDRPAVERVFSHLSIRARSLPPDLASEMAIRLLGALAAPDMKDIWCVAFTALIENSSDQARLMLQLFRPVQAVLTGASESSLDSLPPEQRDFARTVLARFDSGQATREQR